MNFPFKSSINRYSNKYFMGFNASIEFGRTYFFSTRKTGLSFSDGLGFGLYYEPFGSVRQLVHAIDVAEVRRRAKGSFFNEDGDVSILNTLKLGIFSFNYDIRYTYLNRKGAVGVVAWFNFGALSNHARSYGVSAYVHARKLYFNVRLTKHFILQSPLITFGVQYQLSLKKKRKIVQIKKHSFWSRVLNPYEFF